MPVAHIQRYATSLRVNFSEKFIGWKDKDVIEYSMVDENSMIVKRMKPTVMDRLYEVEKNASILLDETIKMQEEILKSNVLDEDLHEKINKNIVTFNVLKLQFAEFDAGTIYQFWSGGKVR